MKIQHASPTQIDMLTVSTPWYNDCIRWYYESDVYHNIIKNIKCMTFQINKKKQLKHVFK